MIDHWEVDGDLLTLEEEIGEGAFGKVYKGVLKPLTTPSRKMFMKFPINAIRKNEVKQTDGLTVAVKMLHGELHCLFRFGNLKKRLELMNKSQPMQFLLTL